MAGYRTWTPGEVITASGVQEFLQDQTVMVFPSDSVRATAVVVPTEGMLSWVEDDNKYQYYSGASWEDLIVPIVGGTVGQAYISGGTADAAFGDVKAQFIATTVTDITTAHTATATDANTILNFTSAATLTIPDVLVETGDMIQVLANIASGTVTIAAGSGVTSWAGAGTAGTAVTFKMDVPYTAAAIIKTNDNEYRVIGRVFA